jgi:osmoprotectant transport system ATP-binding protein
MSSAIEFDHVVFRHEGGSTPTLSGLTLSIEPGERVVLLGRSGSGKTTTLKLINRLLLPSSGAVRVEGTSTSSWDPIRLRRRIGYVLQEIGLFPHMSIERNVGLIPRLEGWAEGRIRERTDELLNLVGLDPPRYRERYPRELSGGQRQRVGVARALAADPPIVLMDEPFGALDPITRLDLQREFSSLARRLNKTIVFVTHDVREAFTLATRIGLFMDGKMVELATPAEFARSSHPEARVFNESLAGVEPAS